SKNELAKPPIAKEDGAHEVLRVWGGPDLPHQFVVETTWDDPGNWGILLVDVARHAAKAYEGSHGINEADALDRIKQLLDAEWSSPTDVPKQIG
ncbi:MAG: DUF5076 domain-containing protein, partial [Gammaproteobacteria bacterium]|nr:DUF5076 domain-containing protein [Gammaproteobacteria bacterium]